MFSRVSFKDLFLLLYVQDLFCFFEVINQKLGQMRDNFPQIMASYCPSGKGEDPLVSRGKGFIVWLRIIFTFFKLASWQMLHIHVDMG